MMARLLTAILWLALAASATAEPAEKAMPTKDSRPQTARPVASERDKELASEILADSDLPLVLDKARALLKTGLTAGSGYGEVWIRDLNTFIEVSLKVNVATDIRASARSCSEIIALVDCSRDSSVSTRFSPGFMANTNSRPLHGDSSRHTPPFSD